MFLKTLRCPACSSIASCDAMTCTAASSLSPPWCKLERSHCGWSHTLLQKQIEDDAHIYSVLNAEMAKIWEHLGSHWRLLGVGSHDTVPFCPSHSMLRTFAYWYLQLVLRFIQPNLSNSNLTAAHNIPTSPHLPCFVCEHDRRWWEVVSHPPRISEWSNPYSCPRCFCDMASWFINLGFNIEWNLVNGDPVWKLVQHIQNSYVVKSSENASKKPGNPNRDPS